METSINVYFYIVPLVVFGPLFLWVFYNFGLREFLKIPADIRRQRQREAETTAQFAAERARKRGDGPTGMVRGPNRSPLGLVMQAITYAWFAAVIGILASSPQYAHQAAGAALIKLNLNHPGLRKVKCHKRSAKELAKLAANMRSLTDCPRERWPVYVELELDGDVIFSEEAAPAGIAGDGPSSFYRTFTVPAGSHRMTMRLRDQGASGFGYEATHQADIIARQVVAVQFDAAEGGFIVK